MFSIGADLRIGDNHVTLGATLGLGESFAQQIVDFLEAVAGKPIGETDNAGGVMSLKSEIGGIAHTLAIEINKTSKWYVALGALLIIAGIAMIVFPLYSGVAVTTVVGAALAITGALYLLNSFMALSGGGFLFRLLLAAVNIIAGVWMLTQPMEGLTALTVFLGIALALSGIFRILFARALTGVPGAGMVIFSGLVSIGLAVLIFAKLPVASEVAVGVLVGIDFISSGSSLTLLAVRAKKFAGAVAEAV